MTWILASDLGGPPAGGGSEFAGGVIGAAVERGGRAVDRFDPAAAFAVLIGANIAIGLR
jgi:hypothetical protein